MAGYLDRLIERANGGVQPLPSVATVPRTLGLDPFEEVVDTAPAPIQPPRTIEKVREASTVIERSVEHAVAVPVVRPAPVSESRPATIQREIVQVAPLPVPAVIPVVAPHEPAPAPRTVIAEQGGEPSLVERVTPIASSPVPAPQLRIPVAEPTEVVERWLAPEPATPSREVVRIIEREQTAPPLPIAAPPPVAPRALAPSPPQPTAPPVVDERPVLSIGRLLVEVRNQPPPVAPPQTIVRNTPAATPTPPAPSVLHRGFGLGQS